MLMTSSVSISRYVSTVKWEKTAEILVSDGGYIGLYTNMVNFKYTDMYETRFRKRVVK